MSTDQIVQAWKSEDDEEKNELAPANPAGWELSDKELEEVVGGFEQVENGPSLFLCSCQKVSCV